MGNSGTVWAVGYWLSGWWLASLTTLVLRRKVSQMIASVGLAFPRSWMLATPEAGGTYQSHPSQSKRKTIYRGRTYPHGGSVSGSQTPANGHLKRMEPIRGEPKGLSRTYLVVSWVTNQSSISIMYNPQVLAGYFQWTRMEQFDQDS